MSYKVPLLLLLLHVEKASCVFFLSCSFFFFVSLFAAIMHDYQMFNCNNKHNIIIFTERSSACGIDPVFVRELNFVLRIHLQELI